MTQLQRSREGSYQIEIVYSKAGSEVRVALPWGQGAKRFDVCAEQKELQSGSSRVSSAEAAEAPGAELEPREERGA